MPAIVGWSTALSAGCWKRQRGGRSCKAVEVVMAMLYGTDYRSADDQRETRLLRRYRRDVMFVAARPQEVAAAGLVAGLVVIPILLVVSGIVAFLFSIVFSGPAVVAGASTSSSIAGLQVTPTSRQDFVLVLAVVILTLAVAGGLSATLR
ncbi:MAG TPA: hypothetical protein VIU62_00400, partial [Chloroflexota bacterium]